MTDRKHPLQIVGLWLATLGGLAFASVFLVVLVNGTWPTFLQPVRSLFEILGASLLGDWAFIVEIWIFIGPGMLIYWLGERLQDRAARKHHSKHNL